MTKSKPKTRPEKRPYVHLNKKEGDWIAQIHENSLNRPLDISGTANVLQKLSGIQTRCDDLGEDINRAQDPSIARLVLQHLEETAHKMFSLLDLAQNVAFWNGLPLKQPDLSRIAPEGTIIGKPGLEKECEALDPAGKFMDAYGQTWRVYRINERALETHGPTMEEVLLSYLKKVNARHARRA